MSGPPEGTPLWKIALTVPERAIDAIEAAFCDIALVVTSYVLEGDRAQRAETLWRVEFLTPSLPPNDLIEGAIARVATESGFTTPDIVVAPIDERDWIAAGLAQQPPTRVGRFIVCGRHSRDEVRPGEIAIEIDAGLAFGTGRHETTYGCLSAISRVLKRTRPRRMLDLGTGSGVLAIALAKATRRPVTAVEIDPVAVGVAGENVTLNGMGLFIDVRNGKHVPRALAFDLIVANILIGPLVRLAPAIARALAPGGRAILSGILDDEEAALIAAYRAQKLALVERIERGSWPTLVFKRRSRGRS
ncbi:MAG: 50S ribosomal protein L11 methyltransferase [Alphaproteobacteria bacterium]|nr:50S ribosomal protein L11 methyltransferase [Alphaproteobacteria bacterium]